MLQRKTSFLLGKYLIHHLNKNMKTLQRNKSVILKSLIYAVLVGLVIVQTTSCTKDATTDKQAQLTIRIADTPANYDAVMVDVQGLEVTGNGGSTVMLNTTAKV